MSALLAGLPSIPEKRYFEIGEVSRICGVKAHVLRYWEQEFPQLRPTRRRKRRYYQRPDVELVRQIRVLLHEQGYTIKGARERIERQQSARASPAPAPAPQPVAGEADEERRRVMRDIEAALELLK